MRLERVREIVLGERGGPAGSWPWTDRFLAVADRQFHGIWRRVELSGTAAAAILLPPHAGEPCRGDRLGLVPSGGATVRAAADALRSLHEDYETANRECWRRIAAAAAAPFSTIVLTPRPLRVPEFATVAAEPSCWYHLDGFHRLVGWAWAGRLTGVATVGAIVAGAPEP